MKIVVILQKKNDVFSFKSSCNNTNTMFTELFYIVTIDIFLNISIDEYLKIV